MSNKKTETLQVTFLGRKLEAGDFVIEVIQVDKEIDELGNETGRDIGKPVKKVTSSQDTIPEEIREQLLSFITQMNDSAVTSDELTALNKVLEPIVAATALTVEECNAFGKVLSVVTQFSGLPEFPAEIKPILDKVCTCPVSEAGYPLLMKQLKLIIDRAK
ncbi:MAG: hypothetical protein GY938_07675 [Ketobacter sp.]|nr:hypothetical protein [Ketobacter sp.]